MKIASYDLPLSLCCQLTVQKVLSPKGALWAPPGTKAPLRGKGAKVPGSEASQAKQTGQALLSGPKDQIMCCGKIFLAFFGYRNL